MEIKLIKPLTLEDKEVKTIDLKLDELTGEDILQTDLEIRAGGDPRGFDNVYNQNVLLIIASKASGIITDDLKKLSAPDFLEVTFTVRNFLMGLLARPEEPESSAEPTLN
ncbi:phage tail assembly protein [Desulfitobacterium chlororespirans]|uniref:Phage tail assembly chaperone protein, E, or 41 or 14 n=1 Tax=Desulfitobacterium chlororespirans DSM 11544 TaxID=1121395 RepID=A0A1M7U308_9FIRM|nr:phage tail assembly protein [Desulfitobacterium chlororespirans]SHN77230.1 Phage tail assembly chaperone protein, E, or 41 or 14 [Desulfitobacterium chlororespirans DSM 11544]